MCKWKGCNEPERHQGYCPTHWMLVKPHKKDTDVKEPYKIPRESKKRAKENRVYLKVREEKLKLFPVCEMRFEGCTVKATDCHHAEGRIGDKLTDINNLISCCRSCHTKAELNPIMAKEMGVSKSRLSKQ